MVKSAIVIFTVIAILCIFINSQINAQPQQVTWDDLKKLQNGEVPKNAKNQILGGLFDKGAYELMIYSPKGQAAIYAKTAKENYIKLDSSTYYPELFNRFVRVEVRNLLTSEAKDLRQIERGIILIGDDFFEADSTIFIKSNLQNAYGAEYINIDAVFFFNLNHFTGWDDIKFVIFDNQGKVERKFKKKDIKKLE